MTNEERLNEFLPTIRKVAAKIAATSSLVDREDIQQELTLFIISRPDIAIPSEATFSIFRLLLGVARMYAFKERQAHYLIDSTFSYEVRDVQRILETVFDRSSWTAVEEGESVEDMVAAHSDVAWAFDRLEEADKQVLLECYRDMKRPASGTPEYRRRRAAIIKLTNMLNHYTRTEEHEGPGRREVISNATAHVLLQSGYSNPTGR